MEQKKLMLTMEETAEFIGIPKSTAYKLAREKRLPVVQIDSRKYCPVRALEQWAEENIGKKI